MPATGLMTVEEFRQLPETAPFYYELRHGELVQVTRPKKKHAVISTKAVPVVGTARRPGVLGTGGTGVQAVA